VGCYVFFKLGDSSRTHDCGLILGQTSMIMLLYSNLKLWKVPIVKLCILNLCECKYYRVIYTCNCILLHISIFDSCIMNYDSKNFIESRVCSTVISFIKSTIEILHSFNLLQIM